MIDHALQNPLAFGQDHSEEITKLVDVADLALLSFQKAKPKLVKVFQNGTDGKNIGLVWCVHNLVKRRSPFFSFKKNAQFQNLMLRMRAIEALALTEKIDPMPSLIDIANVSESSVEVLLILNTVHSFAIIMDLNSNLNF